jgi:hypothetical protein
MSAGSFILDSATRGVLNQNFLYGDSPETIEATGLSSLGSLTASSTSTVQVLVLAESDLDGLSAASESNVTKFVSAASEFGNLSSEVISLVEHISTASADFGELDAFAVPLTERFVSADSQLGALEANANSDVDNIVAASTQLGSLTAQAISIIESQNSANADLGELTAQALSQVIPPTPPPPPTPSIGNGRADYSVPRLKKKIKPEVIKTEIPVVKKTEPARPIFKTVNASADTIAGIFDANAQSQIDFSILEDEAELLLLI